MTLPRRTKWLAGLAVVMLFAAGALYSALFAGGVRKGLHVEGNRLADGGKLVRLLGVDWSSPERGCSLGTPTGRVLGLRINSVRLALEEDCWLGQVSGPPYRGAIASFVARLHASGLFVVLALRDTGAGAPDTARAPRFWREVATAFADDDRVAFDLYDEPYGIDWVCWRDGCTQAGRRLAGMQELVHAVRDGGAKQPIMIAGIDHGADLSKWLDEAPFDPEGQLLAALRVSTTGACSTKGCSDETVARVARRVPVVTTSLGAGGCTPALVARFTAWADSHRVSYLGSARGRCGAELEQHLRSLWGRDKTLIRTASA